MIGRLLGPLVSTSEAGELEIIVVANGCTDNTVEVAGSFGPQVRVVSTPVASKAAALASGDEAASGFPRIYIDADVELGADDARALAKAVLHPGILAAAPQRELALADRPWLVRWWYEVWSRLPEVEQGLFGRGVICLSQAGYERIAKLPPVIADDLITSLAFAQSERVVTDSARVLVHPPRTVTDLFRRRVRAIVGVRQVEQTADAPDSTARTQVADLLAIARRNPAMTVKVTVFVAVSILARVRARRAIARGDFSTWLRDESSRT